MKKQKTKNKNKKQKQKQNKKQNKKPLTQKLAIFKSYTCFATP